MIPGTYNPTSTSTPPRSYGFATFQEHCPVCGKTIGYGNRHPDGFCSTCAKLQRWMPRKLRRDLAHLRAMLDEFEHIMRNALSRFHPPSYIWRQIVSERPEPKRPFCMTTTRRAHRQQLRLPKVRSQLALRRLRAGHLPPRSYHR